MKPLIRWLIVGVWLLAPAAWAETLYVTDQVTVALRADVTPGAPVLATATTGATLEVLERSGSFARVRDTNGVEGWVEADMLANEPPAAQRLKTLRAELDRTRAQLANTQGLLEKARAATTAVNPDTEKLQADLAGVRAQLGKVQTELKKKEDEIVAAVAARDAAVKEATDLRAAAARSAQAAAVAPPPPEPPKMPEPKSTGGFSFLWLGIAFAMLVVGFIGGIVWVRESIRRRMGGLYLRV